MIEFIRPEQIGSLAGVPAGGRVIWGDLRDPAFLPLLRPAPTSSDYADERRPGASDRSFFLARRAVTRSLVGRVTGVAAEDVAIGYDGPGAPRVKGGGCQIAVSGRGPFVAIALSAAPVGVDIEIVHEAVEIITDVLHPIERAALRELDEASARIAFLEIWTAKEAYLKALGTGFNIDPSTFAVAIEDDVIRSISHEGGRAFVEGALLHSGLADRQVIIAAVSLRA